MMFSITEPDLIDASNFTIRRYSLNLSSLNISECPNDLPSLRWYKFTRYTSPFNSPLDSTWNWLINVRPGLNWGQGSIITLRRRILCFLTAVLFVSACKDGLGIGPGFNWGWVTKCLGVRVVIDAGWSLSTSIGGLGVGSGFNWGWVTQCLWVR